MEMEAFINNHVFDFVGIGKRKFEYNEKSLKKIIAKDLQEGFDFITLTRVHAKLKPIYDDYELEIRVLVKVEPTTTREQKDEMEATIDNYLKNTFLQ